jgi:Sulfotransferase family
VAQPSQAGRNGAGSDLGEAAAAADPVFVLCMGRSGSTLLRLVLDTHPELACPPETNIPALCAQLAVVWSLIEGAPLSAQRGDEPPQIPDAAIAGIRQTMDLMTGPYLARRGKKLLCDKSLSTARFAELLIRIYPGTRFVCLFRHPMDVISSGIEACPWGLNGYGFDPYIAGSPGNAVLALARFWHDQAQAIAAVEQAHPGRCHRVRYEDMVADPEQVAAGVFDFIGVGPVPGIAQAVFTREHERFGPADHKIWHTSAISQDSVARSATVPAGLIAPPVLESINQLLDKLGYLTVDENWGTADMPASLLAPGPASCATPAPPMGEPVTDIPVLTGRLQAGLARIDSGFAARWPAAMAAPFTVAVRQPRSADPVRWLVVPGARTLTRDGQPGAASDDGRGEGGQDAQWSIVGTAQAWQEVLAGRLNLSVALRRGELRYADFGDTGALSADARIAMLAALLGLTCWPGGQAAASQSRPRPWRTHDRRPALPPAGRRHSGPALGAGNHLDLHRLGGWPAAIGPVRQPHPSFINLHDAPAPPQPGQHPGNGQPASDHPPPTPTAADIPLAQIPPPLLAHLNQLHHHLAYPPITSAGT